MASFSDLPNELIIGIWGYVIEPDDVESFALVSKRIYGLSSQFVNEHASLTQQYSKIKIAYRKGNYESADLLEKMLLNTRIAFYISSLQMSIWKPRWAKQTTPQVDTMALFEGAIRASPLITGSEVEDWITDVGKGNEDAMTALIIMRLTKLKGFRLWQSKPDEGPYLLRTLERITQSPEAASQPRQSISGTKINKDSQITSTRRSIFFSIREMQIASPGIMFDLLCQILHYTKPLKSFTYWRHRGTNIEISRLCDKLLERSQLSLQKLSIHGEDTGLGDITQFHILAKVAVKFDILLGNTDDTCRDLADVLPMSIESVQINCPPETIPFHVLRRLILDMIKCKMERLPKLQELKFRFGMYQDEATTRNMELITELQGMSANVGVLLSAGGELVPFKSSSVRS